MFSMSSVYKLNELLVTLLLDNYNKIKTKIKIPKKNECIIGLIIIIYLQHIRQVECPNCNLDNKKILKLFQNDAQVLECYENIQNKIKRNFHLSFKLNL